MTSDAQRLDATQLREAIDLVDDEQAHIDETLAAYDRFISGLSRIPADTPSASTSATTASGGGPQSVSAAVRNESTDTDSLQQVRALFADTVYPCSTAAFDEPEPLLVTIREELGEEIALAVSPSTDGILTADLKGAIGTAADHSRMELRAMDRRLDRELESLRAARSVHEDCVDWLTADHSPLSSLGFDRLSQRHERLADFRGRCDQLAADRQSTLHEATNHAMSADLSHEQLVAYLYQPLPTDYPVLSAAAQLTDLCFDCQRTVRDHLVRRV